MTDRLVLSVAEAAEVLGVSDDLVYELTERGELPCLRFGRRKVIPRRAIELLVESAVADFHPAAVITRLNGSTEQPPRRRTEATGSIWPDGTVRPPVQTNKAPIAVTSNRAPRPRPGAPSRPAATGARRNVNGNLAPLCLFDDGDVHDPASDQAAGRQTG